MNRMAVRGIWAEAAQYDKGTDTLDVWKSHRSALALLFVSVALTLRAVKATATLFQVTVWSIPGCRAVMVPWVSVM